MNTKQTQTPVQRTEHYAREQGFIVKRNAVVMDGLMPSGILVRREEDKEYTILKLI